MILNLFHLDTTQSQEDARIKLIYVLHTTKVTFINKQIVDFFHNLIVKTSLQQLTNNFLSKLNKERFGKYLKIRMLVRKTNPTKTKFDGRQFRIINNTKKQLKKCNTINRFIT